ncbi:hypothetical protein [Hydrogenophaga sp. PAMC20947]|uniref:hypothetical protein n=1 Tax=Hydrogenophaga sp. PAMC20947 TaxID=2565558 RepID=UPI00109DCAD1|nr:hypothetical protein [Hydrogenophaga sp. PAMC20947]QCB46619.1 hypothetical protein E5678_11645 [Hydrogenophaga sp. PAMC20947]
MYITTRFAALTIVAACASNSAAQTLEKAYILAEPLQYSNQGNFRGCGLNLKLLQESESKSRDYVTLSVNFWMDSPTSALVKTALSRATIGVAPSSEPQPLETSWARVKGAEPLIPEKSMRGEDQALLTTVELSAAVDFVTTVMQGSKEIQVGFRQPRAKYERIFYGTPNVEQESKKLLESCFGEFVSRLGNSPK